MLICGSKGDGHSSHLAPALLYDLEGFPVHVLDVPVLYGTSTRTPEESCTQVSAAKNFHVIAFTDMRVQFERPVSSVFKHIAVGAGSLGFDFRAGQNQTQRRQRLATPVMFLR